MKLELLTENLKVTTPTTPWLKCACGKWFFSVAEHRDHRNAGECPFNAPDTSSSNYLHWSRRVRTLSKREIARKEKDAAHIAEMKADPVIQENARRKKEERKALRTAVKRFQVRARK